jgi:predicted acetyltransferase
MDVRIRAISPDEFGAWIRTLEGAFGGRATDEEVERERAVAEVERCLAAFDGDEMVGCAGAVSFTMTVPGGGQIPAAGVTGVGVKQTHRRRGVNSALMRRQLDDVRAGPEAIAVLHASEGGIYGRYGYGIASYSCTIDADRDRSAFVRGYRQAGSMRLLDREQALGAFLPVYDEARRRRPGMMELSPTWFAYRFDEGRFDDRDAAWFYAAHETGGAIDGYAVYRVKDDWEHALPKSELVVEEVQALTSQAYADAWRFLFDLDLIHRVTAWNRPPDDPLLRLLAEPRRLRFSLKDGLWIRLVDLPRALCERAYAAEGRVVFEVTDAFCPWNEGRYALEAGPAVVECRRTDDEADVALSASELGGVYLGGTTFQQLRAASLVEELRPGAVERADRVFASTPAPNCSFMF